MKNEQITENLDNKVGNRCGHSRASPRFYTRPNEHKRTFDVIHRATERIQEYYWQPIDNWLPNLNHARISDRQQRSERRESIVAMLGVMLNQVDIATLSIVKLNNSQLKHVSIKELADKAGINEKRAERAISDLKAAGYIELEYRYETLPDNKIRPLIALKRLSLLFFYHLGFSYEKLKRVQEYAQKKLDKFNKKLKMAANEAKEFTKNAWGSLIKKPTYRPYSGKSRYEKAENVEKERKKVEQLSRLRQQYPNLALSELATMLK